MTEKSRIRTALERLRARIYQEKSVEEQIVPGQTRVDDIVQPDVVDEKLLSDEEKKHMEWLNDKQKEVEKAMASLKDKIAARVRHDQEEALRKAQEEQKLLEQQVEDEVIDLYDKVKKDVKTISISWVHLHEKLECDEFLDLIGHRMKLKPNGSFPTKSECGRAVLRWMIKNPGKVGIIPDEEAEKNGK